MLSDKVVVVTGGAGLLGQEFIRTIVKNKGIAIIADINKDTAKETKDELSDELETCEIDFVELDITSKISLTLAIKYLDAKFGKIDALVNNAYPRNKAYGRQFFDVTYEDFLENAGMNIGGYFLVSQQFAQYFNAQGFGNIINLSSIYGVIAPRFEVYDKTQMTMPVEYAAIKAALIHLTRYMAKYFKGMNIRVNAISPGGILDRQPDEFVSAYNNNCMTKGMLRKSDINGTLLYLLSDLSQYVNGQNIIVDDGYCL